MVVYKYIYIPWAIIMQNRKMMGPPLYSCTVVLLGCARVLFYFFPMRSLLLFFHFHCFVYSYWRRKYSRQTPPEQRGAYRVNEALSKPILFFLSFLISFFFLNYYRGNPTRQELTLYITTLLPTFEIWSERPPVQNRRVFCYPVHFFSFPFHII